jgi:hypothetical protein
MAELSAITAVLDAKQAEARVAFEGKDLAAYTAIFSQGLRYHQPDGRTIGRDQLMRYVRTQFKRFSRVKSSFVRERLDLSDDSVTEVLNQTASATATAFLFVHRTWNVARKSRFVWKATEMGWQIDEVFVLEERVTSSGFQFGLVPKLTS